MGNRMKNKVSGISMISLVVTIIVLLILAGVSITAITGNNHIIKNTHVASDESNKSKEQEIIDQVTLYAMDKNKFGNVDKQDVISELQNYQDVKNIEELEAGVRVTFESDNTYIIGTDGNIYNSVDDLPKTPEQIKQERVKDETNVGKKINFVSKYSNNLIWRLFYADDDYVYLISSKPTSDGTGEVNSQRTAHTTLGYLGLIQWYTPNYSGSSAITDEFLRSLNSKWYSTLGNNEATNENAKAVAWLMDQNVWNGWKDEAGLAKYVIGGPTLELFAKSYNSNASNNNTHEIKYSANTEFGYTINNNSTTEKLYFDYNFNDGIYTSNIEESDKDYDSYWIASPKAMVGDTQWEGNAIFTINKNKGFYFGASYYGLGVRPVAIIRTTDYVNSNLGFLE